MGHALDVAESHRQNRLGAVERLNLALLIHTQHQSVIGRVEIQARNIAYLLDEERIGGEFEGTCATGLNRKCLKEPMHG